MLKIHKKLKIPLSLIPISLSGIFLFQYLIFIPEYSEAKTISTPIYDESKKDTRTLSQIDTMQEMTTGICRRSATLESKSLADTRDSQSYRVTKLNDGNCWMTENISYDGQLRIWHEDAYGGYYNWNNAKAVCDFAGWQLPTKSQYESLLNTYNISNNSAGSSALRDTPLSFRYGGYYGRELYDKDYYGYYWSSTPNGINTGVAYSLRFYTYGASMATDSGNTQFGFSVRCVARTDIPDVPAEPDVNNPDISVTIPNIITLSLSSEVVDIDTSTSNPAEGNFTATVTSNSKYDLALSATASEGQTPHTDLKNEDPNKTTSIPALSSTNPIVTEADESWWGIKCTNPTDSTNSTNCTKTAYTGLTLNPDTYFTSTSGTPSTGTETPFTIGIKVSPNLPSGTYSTSIQVTASSTGSN